MIDSEGRGEDGRSGAFGLESQRQINTCDERLQRVMLAASEMYNFSVLEGFRDEVAQNRAYAKGLSQKQWPYGEHNHSPSTACDVAPYPIDWSDREAARQRFVLLAGIIIATGFHLGIPIRWGGDWNMNGDTRDEHFRDYGHFELAP